MPVAKGRTGKGWRANVCGQRVIISLSTAWITAMRSARRAATTAGSSGGDDGLSAGVSSCAVGGDGIDGEVRDGVACEEVATGGGFATAGVAVGDGTADFGLVR